MRALAMVALFSSVAPVLPAQVFLVDATGGPTANFTSIATAVTTVPSGSVLLINPGIYDGFTIQGKSLTLIADFALISDATTSSPVRVDGLAANQSVTLQGLSIQSVLGVGAFELSNSAGTIVLEGCRGDRLSSPFGGQLLATNCEHIHLRNSSFDARVPGAPGLETVDSNITAISASFSGDVAPAVVQTRGRIDALSTGFYGYAVPAAVQMQGGELICRRGSILAGNGPNGLLVDGTGALRRDPATTLYNASPQPFGSGIAVQTDSMPGLQAWAGELGGHAAATIEGGGAITGVLALGFPGAPYVPAGFSDPLWLAPGTESIQAIGTTPLSATYAVPNASWVLGIRIVWQGVGLSPSGVMLSNPSVYAHR
ncbi:MAG: hypothetical protein NXI31_07755 [bacterium]|nr:hypothetical protein [bacterium]